MATDGPGRQQPPLTITDPQVMRALAHPARQVILEHLSGTNESVTATECAQVSGLSPSATSYHLRELAKFGLVEEAPSRGDGRERVWRAAVTGISLYPGRTDEPETRAAERALMDVFLSRQGERLRQWVERAKGESTDWYDAVTATESILLLTAEELSALKEAVSGLVEPYRKRSRTDPPADARLVAAYFQAVPTD